MKNIKMRMKLMISFMIIVMLAVVIGGVGVLSLNTLKDDTQLLSSRTDTVITSARIGRNIQQQRAAYRGAAAFKLLDLKDSFYASVDEVKALENEYFSLYSKLYSLLVTNESKRLLNEIDRAYGSYAEARDGFIALMRNDNMRDEDMLRELEKPAMYADNLVKNVTVLTDFINDLTDKQAVQAAVDAKLAAVVMLAIIAAAVVASLFLSIYISRNISKPLSMMQDAIVRVGHTGSLYFTSAQLAAMKEEGKNKDEIGQSFCAFNKLLERLLYIGHNLNAVANGDLTAHIELLSENDEMGIALTSMIDGLNDIFKEIRSVSGQVLAASSEIAEGAQQLAFGNSEQEASVDSILSSVGDMSKQAELGFTLARKSVENSNAICAIAQNGSEKMKSLSNAVQEMRGASYAIDAVVKIIDEIAFNINLLALNAAVEAAHAGSHGEGFAIVADEIRKLASKSAKAVNETALLISTSIKKSDDGILASREAADALEEIVVGVEETAKVLATIAEQSEYTKTFAGQVDQEMQQVARVVRDNSETSEKNAATSEEMNCQANALDCFVERFELKTALQ